MALQTTESVRTRKIHQGGFVAFGPQEEAFVSNNNIIWDQVTDPGTGYAMSFKTDEAGNLVADPFNDDSFTLRAIPFGDHDKPALVWHPKGGEDGNGAWVEEEKEYATAFEAVMALTQKNERGEYVIVMKEQNIEVRLANGWNNEFMFKPLLEQNGIEPGTGIRKIIEIIKPLIETNGIAAINLESGEAKIIKVPNFENTNFIYIIGEGDKTKRSVDIYPNKQGVKSLELRINISNSEEGMLCTIYYDEETNTFIVYVKIHPKLMNSSGEEYRKGKFAAGIITASGLIGTPQQKNVLYFLEQTRIEQADCIYREITDRILATFRAAAAPHRTLWNYGYPEN